MFDLFGYYSVEMDLLIGKVFSIPSNFPFILSLDSRFPFQREK